MKKNIILNYREKKIDLELKEMKGFKEAIGLMFCRREKAKALLFSFKKPIDFTIHSFFVFFEFIAIWLDEKGKVDKSQKLKLKRNFELVTVTTELNHYTHKNDLIYTLK